MNGDRETPPKTRVQRTRRLFWNADERRLRAGWRIGLQLSLFAAILGALTGLSKLLGTGVGAALLVWPLYFAAVFGSIHFLARNVDHRPFADFGLHVNGAWWRDLAFGFFLGAFMMTGMFFTEKAAGWVTVTGAGVTSMALPVGLAVLVKLVEWIAVGASEELVFRGYQLKNLSEGLSSKRWSPRRRLWLAALVSSLFFGLAHLANRNSTAVSTLNIVLGGLLLSLPILITGELAASIGLHISWNLFEGSVYGFPVSGVEEKTHVLTIRQTGPVIWTGGSFGPEAGLVCIVWMLIAAGLLVAWFRARGVAGETRAAPPIESGA